MLESIRLFLGGTLRKAGFLLGVTTASVGVAQWALGLAVDGLPPYVLVAVGFSIVLLASVLAFHELRRNPPFENSERKLMREKHDLELSYYTQHYEGVSERLRQAVKEAMTWQYRDHAPGLSKEQKTRKLKPDEDLRKDFADLRVGDLFEETPRPERRP